MTLSFLLRGDVIGELDKLDELDSDVKFDSAIEIRLLSTSEWWEFIWLDGALGFELAAFE